MVQHYPSHYAIYYRRTIQNPSAENLLGRSLLFFLILFLFTATFINSIANPSYSETIAWQALDEGAIAIITHPGEATKDDPYVFRMGDCSTQTNLTEQDRLEARHIGNSFRNRGIDVGIVFHSRWCRTREAAALAFPGLTFAEAAIDSFNLRPEHERFYTAQAKKIIKRWDSSSALVMITHPENVFAITGVNVLAGEALVLQPINNAIDVVGKITF